MRRVACSSAKAGIIRGGEIRPEICVRQFRDIQKSTNSSREKFAKIWESLNRETRRQRRGASGGEVEIENAEMKKLLFWFLFFVSAFYSDAQTNLSIEIGKHLPIGKCDVDVMGLTYPKRFLALSEKLQIAVSTNKNWWLNYIKDNAKDGEPLPYSPKFGLTKEEYSEYLFLAEKRTLGKVGDGILQVKTNAVDYEFDGGSTLPDLTGIKINLKELTVTTPFAVLKNPQPEESQGGPALGAFSGYQWNFEQDDIEKGNGTDVSFLIGNLKESGRQFIYYKGSMMKSNNPISNVGVVIFYDRK